MTTIMDKEKKRLKKSRQLGSSTEASSAGTSRKSASDNANADDDVALCGSPDFLSSQQCFSIGWDWSGPSTNKPSIRLVEQPKKKNNLLEPPVCHRPRRLIRTTDDSEMFDDSALFNELKALAADLKRVPESNSPVASPPTPNHRRCTGVLLTPTIHKRSKRSLISVAINSSITSTPNHVTESPRSSVTECENQAGKENLDDLFDDSIGADLLKVTQDIELNYVQCELETPNHKESGSSSVASSKRKCRLSLSSNKKDCSTARRKIDSGDEDKSSSKRTLIGNSSSGRGDDGRQPESRIEFDDFDDECLLSIGEMEENKLKSSESPPENKFVTKPCITESKFDDENDDILVSPEVLDMIDIMEKKATQESLRRTPDLLDLLDLQPRSTKECRQPSLEIVDIVIKEQGKNLEGPPASTSSSLGKVDSTQKRSKIQEPARKKTLCLSSKCTPEEIEKKRQTAIKKRLQLKTKK